MGSDVTLTGIQWRKSSHSGDQGGECVECAPVGPLTWRKSSYSGDQGGNCVEIAQPVAEAGAVVAVRDSKTSAGPVLTVGPAGFSRFLEWVTGAG
ncbi:DUF397 domain-containing protein [Streptomyces sp. B21-105]|uniref:DUF397 domain-containing protein n=1 Tax=Streptomyces sp. B21-105 TaxID=3039417 RepID=UPI002FF276AC